MTRKISCHKRKCAEDESLEKEMEELYDNGNIADQIQLDLFKETMR